MTSEKTKIAKNAGILVITVIISRMLGTLLTVIIARKLGASSLGLLAFAISFTIPFGFLAGFGFKNLISRDIAKEPTRTGSYLGNIFVIKLILSVSTIFLIVSVLYLMNYDQDKILVVLIVAFIMMLNSYNEFFAAFFRAHQKVQYEAVVTIILNFLSVSTGLTILFLGYGLVPLISVRFLVYLVCFALGFGLVVKKLAVPSFDIRLQFCLQILKSSAPFAILGIVTNINAQMGTILLSFMKGDLATGWFSAAQRLCGIFSFIPMAFAGATLPPMAKFSQKSMHDTVVKTYEGTIKYLLIIVLPLSVGISILADDFILIIYGEEYMPSIIALRILIWLLVFSFLNRACMIAFAAINKEKIYLKFQALGTITNICVNITLIPLLGYIGTCIAVVLSQITILTFSISTLSNHFRQTKMHRIYIKPIIAVLIMGTFLILFRQQNVLLLVPISAILYCLSLYMIRTFNNDELSIIRELFRRKATKLKFN